MRIKKRILLLIVSLVASTFVVTCIYCNKTEINKIGQKIKTIYAEEENEQNMPEILNQWDVSATSADNVTAKFYSDGTLELSGTGVMKDYANGILIPYYRVIEEITNFVISEGITEIAKCTFSGCNNLTNISVSEENENYSDIDGVLFNKNKTILIRYPQAKNQEEYSIPDGVLNIGNSAFAQCTKLTSITIAETVTSIKYGAFWKCEYLNNINVSESNQKYSSLDGVLFNKNKTELIQYPIGKTDREYTIPDDVEKIGDKAFYLCNRITSIIISEGVKTIGEAAFRDCEKLASVIMQNGLENIGKEAFFQCGNLRKVEMPDTVTYIGAHAFATCSNLSNIRLSNGLTSIEYGTFYQTNLPSITIPEGITDIGSCAFSCCTNLRSINMSNNVINIGNDAFYCCNKLTSIAIPNNVTEIKDNTFQRCSKLENVIIPEGVLSIGNNAFKECDALISIVIPDSVKNIGSHAFDKCINLGKMILSENIESLGEYCFNNCDVLEKVIIPNNEIIIGDNAFKLCRSLVIYCHDNSNAKTYAENNDITYIIDDEAPIIETEYSEGGLISGIALKDELSGISAYTIVRDENDITMWTKVENTTESVDIEADLEDMIISNEKYYIYAKDALGNISNSIIPLKTITPNMIVTELEKNSYEYTSEEIKPEITVIVTDGEEELVEGIDYELGEPEYYNNVEVGENATVVATVTGKDKYQGEVTVNKTFSIVDTTNPEIISVIKSTSEWVKEKDGVTVTVNAADYSPLEYSFDNGETWHEQNAKTYKANVENIVIKVRDIYGNETQYNEEVSIDNIYKLDRIEIKEEPKTSYNCREEFNAEGMKVVAVYKNDETEDEKEEEVTEDIEIVGGKDLAIECESITIKYEENGETKTVVQKITVSHDYEEEEILPTCTEKGYTRHTCTRCGDSYTDNETEALGHAFENGKCTRCGIDEPVVKIESEELEIDEENNYIKAINAQTTVEELKEMLETNAVSVIIKDKENHELEEEDIIGTGAKIYLTNDYEEKEFTLIVTGDVDGNGLSNFWDMIEINSYRLGLTTIEPIEIIAGDTNEDGEVDFWDMLEINKLRLGL